MKNKYTHILWDFNGTIFDDIGASIAAVNTLLAERGLKTLDSKEKYQEVFDFPIIDYYRRIGFDFDKEPYEDIAVEWVAEYTAREKTANTVEGVRELMELFKNNGLFSFTKEQINLPLANIAKFPQTPSRTSKNIFQKPLKNICF